MMKMLQIIVSSWSRDSMRSGLLGPDSLLALKLSVLHQVLRVLKKIIRLIDDNICFGLTNVVVVLNVI